MHISVLLHKSLAESGFAGCMLSFLLHGVAHLSAHPIETAVCQKKLIAYAEECIHKRQTRTVNLFFDLAYRPSPSSVCESVWKDERNGLS